MSADTQITPTISAEQYQRALKNYKHLAAEQQPSKTEVEKNIAYNLANGIEAGEEKKRGTNKTPNKKKRKK